MYKIVRKSMHFGSRDVVLSKHRTEEAAQKAFDRVVGHAVLLSPDGKVLNHRII